MKGIERSTGESPSFNQQNKGSETADTNLNIKGESEPEGCVFCNIIADKIQSSKITRKGNALAFMSLEGNPLVITEKHITVDEIGENVDEVVEAFKLAVELILPIKKAIEASGINIVASLGKSAGQEIGHFHVHLITRVEGDKKIRFKNLDLPSREKLDDIASKIRMEFDRTQEKV